MALNDMYELRVKGRYAAVTNWLNVYHVERRSAVFTAEDIAQAYVDWILPVSVALQSTLIGYDSVEVINLGDVGDFFTLDLSGFSGLVAGDTMPVFAAFGIRFNRTRRDIRHGFKRLIGVPEAYVTNGSVVGAGLTGLVDYGNSVVQPWEHIAAPGVEVCSFAVILRICAEVGPLGVCLKYRLPETDAELEFYVPTNFTPNDFATHQTSRSLL